MSLPADEVHHARRVLRLAQGAPVVVTDGEGRYADGHLSAGEVSVDKINVEGETSPSITVYQAATKGGANDEILERLGELGIGRFRVFESQRTVARWDSDRAARVSQRWETIARTAGKQSRHARFVDTGPPLSWKHLTGEVASQPHTLLLWEEAKASFRDALPAEPDRLALIVGPEGGFSPEEADELSGFGATPVSLGPGIIRAENAAFLAASLCLYAYGAIG